MVIVTPKAGKGICMVRKAEERRRLKNGWLGCHQVIGRPRPATTELVYKVDGCAKRLIPLPPVRERGELEVPRGHDRPRNHR